MSVFENKDLVRSLVHEAVELLFRAGNEPFWRSHFEYWVVDKELWSISKPRTSEGIQTVHVSFGMEVKIPWGEGLSVEIWLQCRDEWRVVVTVLNEANKKWQLSGVSGALTLFEGESDMPNPLKEIPPHSREMRSFVEGRSGRFRHMQDWDDYAYRDL